MDFETIIFEKKGPIGVLTLNRPDRLNAINFKMSDELRAVLEARLLDFDCRVLVVTGAGRGFCAGLDMKDSAITGNLAQYTPKMAYQLQQNYSTTINLLRRIPQPVIGAINGAAVGVGLSIAMACDVRLSVANAKYCAAYINIGVGGADMGSSWLLPRLVGLSNAARYIMTGDTFLGEEAHRIGLVQGISTPEKLLDDAMAVARTMASKSPIGLRLTKEALNQNVTAATFEDALRLEDRNQSLCISELAFAAAKARKD